MSTKRMGLEPRRFGRGFLLFFMMKQWDFEKPIVELENKIGELKEFTRNKRVDLSAEIDKLEEKLKNLKKQIYSKLTAWQKVQIARHPQRPTTLDYIDLVMDNFVELHGDRLYADDKAMVCGLATLAERKLVVIGHQKGKDTKENIERNFGCAHPEGYRKAMRIMKLAERFSSPVIIPLSTRISPSNFSIFFFLNFIALSVVPRHTPIVARRPTHQ